MAVDEERGMKQMLNSDGRPKIVDPASGLIILVLVLLIYAVMVPFNLVFKVNGEEVLCQSGVSAVSNFEKNASELEGSEAVYSEDAASFFFVDGDEEVDFESPNFKLRMKMALTAAKNLVTFNWDREYFVIELNAK